MERFRSKRMEGAAQGCFISVFLDTPGLRLRTAEHRARKVHQRTPCLPKQGSFLCDTMIFSVRCV